MTLHPDKNPGCREFASSKFMAARRARDTLMKLPTADSRLARCDEAAALALTREEEPSSDFGEPVPALHALYRMGRRWWRRTVRTTRQRLERFRRMVDEAARYFVAHPAIVVLAAVGLQLIAAGLLR